jgi:hypothetical protein
VTAGSAETGRCGRKPYKRPVQSACSPLSGCTAAHGHQRRYLMHGENPYGASAARERLQHWPSVWRWRAIHSAVHTVQQSSTVQIQIHSEQIQEDYGTSKARFVRRTFFVEG